MNDKNWLGAGKNGTVAISAHYGRSRVQNQEVDSTGVALDWNLPFSERVGISGEAFWGAVGLDDPRNDDLQSVKPRDWRTRNLASAVDAIYKFTPQFSVGAEVRSFRTDYFLTGARGTTHYEPRRSLFVLIGLEEANRK